MPKAIYQVPAEVIFKLLNLPQDCKPVPGGMFFDWDTNTLKVKIEHPNAPKNEDGARLPYMSLVLGAEDSSVMFYRSDDWDEGFRAGLKAAQELDDAN